MIIRKALEKDIDQVREIANVPGLQSLGENRAPSKRWFNCFILKNQMFFVAEENEVIGFILGEETNSNWALLWEIGVSKKERNKGTGNQLLETFEKECNIRKLRGIIAYAHNNQKTLKFFKKNKYSFGENYFEIRKDL